MGIVAGVRSGGKGMRAFPATQVVSGKSARIMWRSGRGKESILWSNAFVKYLN